MKNKIFAIIFLCGIALTAGAGNAADNVTVENLLTERSGRSLRVDMDLKVKGLKVGSNRCVLLQPSIVNGPDSVALPPVAVYGRSRYYYFLRNGGDRMAEGADGMTYMAGDLPETIAYSRKVDYQEWMDGARISLTRLERGCKACETRRAISLLGTYREEFFPTLVYMQPPASREKRRSLEGRSFIDFPVDKTEIYPDYRRNPIELDSIRRTIDIVRNDPDARIDSIRLKGFASPESPYSHNRELAIGRTEALKKYINQLYRFENVEFLTDYEPEDWDGLRRFVEGSNIDHRAEILELIDSDMEPDAKEWKIKSSFPDDYRFMLAEFYPALRHTDYKVSYVITSYSDPETILALMKTRPQNLSENEFYVAASSLQPGSEEFTEVFETAVRMFPDDENANINAANAAIRRDDFTAAERYLEKAGSSAEADYARAALAIRKGDYDAARAMLSSARYKGLDRADQTLGELDTRTK